MKYFKLYLLFGILNWCFGILIYWLIIKFTDFKPFINVAISNLLSIIEAHYVQRKFVWKTNSKYFLELTKFFRNYLAQFILNIVILQAFVSLSNTNEFQLQIIISTTLTIVLYFANKKWVFYK